MPNRVMQNASQEPFLGAWALGLTAKRRRELLESMRRWKAVPFLLLGRLLSSSDASLIRLKSRLSLPWLSPRWLEMTHETLIKASSTTEKMSPGFTTSPTKTPRSDTAESLGIVSIGLQWAVRRVISAKPESEDVLTRVTSLFMMLNRHTWIPLANIVQLHTARSEHLIPIFPVSPALPKESSEPRRISPSEGGQRSGQEFEADTEPNMLLPRREINPGGEVSNTAGRAMPYPITSVGMGRIWVGGANISHPVWHNDSRHYSAESNSDALVLQPRLGQPPALPVLGLLTDTIRQTVKREIAEILREEDAKQTAVLPSTESEPSPSSTHSISDEMGRAVMQKLRSIAEEERFRSGKLH